MEKEKRRFISIVGLVLVLAVLSGQVRAELFTNGGFELGDLTGWSGTGTGGSSATVVTTHGLWTPTEGSYFALLKASGSDKYYLLTRTFTPTAPEEILAFDYFFDGDGTTHPVTATADILDLSGASVLSTPMITFTDASNDFPPAPDWATFSSSIEALGLTAGTTYQLAFKIVNGHTGNPNCYLGIDNDAVFVPVPAGVILGMLGLGVAGVKLRRFA